MSSWRARGAGRWPRGRLAEKGALVRIRAAKGREQQSVSMVPRGES